MATDRGVHGTLRRLRAVSGTDSGCTHASRTDGHLSRSMDQRYSRGVDPFGPEKSSGPVARAVTPYARSDEFPRSRCIDSELSRPIPSLSLPDPDDRHVLAAAIRGRVDVIVTYNTKDFPEEAIAPYEVSAQHPDVFLTHVPDLAPGSVLAALQRLRQSLRNPPVEVGDYLSRLEQHGLSSFVAKLREFETLL